MGIMLDNPFLTPRPEVRRIEEQAWRCLEICQEKLSLPEIPLPVPVEEFIEGPLKIRFGIADLSHLGPAVLGAAFIREREILISDQLSHEGRLRFTCAHELGHIMLHGRVRRVFQETEVLFGASTNRYERQADRFAAAFLMPIPLLVMELYRICDDYRLDHKACIVELMMDTPESEWLWKKRFLPALTQRFSVSLTATLNRFRDIRLEDGKPFLLPKHLARLMTPQNPHAESAKVRIVDGIPTRRTKIEGP